MELSPEKIKENYSVVREEIYRAARVSGREFEDVKLVVVTKGQPMNVVRAAIAADFQWLGENYVEEAEQKIRTVQEMAEHALEWHMIGHIQSRKARRVCKLFDFVHSVDSVKLAKRLNRCAYDIGRIIPVLLECNVSGEKSKFGWMASEEEKWDDLLSDFYQLTTLHNLQINGLMTMAPYMRDAEDTRPFFRKLRNLSKYLKDNIQGCEWSELSMGMSGDYQIAIQEGATIVRIGTAILGKRRKY
jgi:pyridoxal phosphate enzyme (YggS family)